MGFYIGTLTLDNRTTSSTITLKQPTTLVQGLRWNGDLVVPPGSGEQSVTIWMGAGPDTNATLDNLIAPFVISSGSDTVSGTLRIYTAGGQNFPDLCIAEVTANGSTITTTISTSMLDELAELGSTQSMIGTFYLTFSDAGTQINASSTGASTIETVLAGIGLVTCM